MIVNCDECKKDFEVDVKVKKIKDDIENTYFICPTCEHEYVAYYTNAKIRKKQEEISKLVKKIKLNKDVGIGIELNKKYNKLNKNIKEEMRSLRNRFEN